MDVNDRDTPFTAGRTLWKSNHVLRVLCAIGNQVMLEILRDEKLIGYTVITNADIVNGEIMGDTCAHFICSTGLPRDDAAAAAYRKARNHFNAKTMTLETEARPEPDAPDDIQEESEG